MNKGFYGIENLALIPGSVGAAPIQNIGAYGVELSDVVYEVSAMDIRTGEIIKFDYEHCKFSYRNSFFKQKEGKNFIVTSVTLQLSSAWQPNIAYPSLKKVLTSTEPSPLQVFDAVCKIRGSKLPDPGKLGNAGSFFKNPIISREKLTSLQLDFPKIPVFDSEINEFVKVPAAWLLEKAGWKGKTRGKAAVSTNHALVLVNLGGASGQDIQLLALEISSSVLEQFGIALEPEVQLI
jgi:UDP-N-acetylmuramate dehydrogenase